MPGNSPLLSHLISSSVSALLSYPCYHLLCSIPLCFYVWSSPYSAWNPLYSSEPALVPDSINLISSDLFLHLNIIWYNAFKIYGKGSSFFMNTIRNKPRGIPFLIFPRGFEVLPSHSFAMKFSGSSLPDMLLWFALAALCLLAQGRQPACHCIQSPAKLSYQLFFLVLQIAFTLKEFLFLSYCFKRGTLCCCMNLTRLKVTYLASFG